MVDYRYEVEVVLVTGQVVREHITEEQGKELAARPGFVWGSGISEDEKPSSAIVTLLGSQLDDGRGFLMVRDPVGRKWVIPSKQILCFNVRDMTINAPPQARRIGFEFNPSGP